MTFEGVLKQELSKISVLNDNIYPLSVPESVPAPYVAYVQAGGEYLKTLDGYSKPSEVIYEINILTEKYGQLKQLEKQVVNTLKGLINVNTDDGVIQDVSVDVPIEKYEESVKLQRANIEFTVYF